MGNFLILLFGQALSLSADQVFIEFFFCAFLQKAVYPLWSKPEINIHT